MSKSKKTKQPATSPIEQQPAIKKHITSPVWMQSKIVFVIGALVVAAIYIFLYQQIFDHKIADAEDNLQYIFYAKSLAYGYGFTNWDGSLHTNYPIFHPLVMSIVLRAGGTLITCKILNGIYFGLALLLFYGLFYKLTNNILIAFATTLFVETNVVPLWYSTVLFSEIPFLFYSSLAILLFYKLMDKTQVNRKSMSLAILFCIFACVLPYIRFVGYVFLVAALLFLLIHITHNLLKYKKLHRVYTATLVILALVFGVYKFAWDTYGSQFNTSDGLPYVFNGYGTYLLANEDGTAMTLKDYPILLERLQASLLNYFSKTTPNLLFLKHITTFSETTDIDLRCGLQPRDYYSTHPSGLDYFIGSITFGFIIFGGIQYRKNKLTHFFAIYCLGYFLAISLNFPKHCLDGCRFLLPIFPILMVLFITGLCKLVTLIANRIITETNVINIALHNATMPVVLALFALFLYPKYSTALEIEMANAHIKHLVDFSDVDYNIKPWTLNVLNYLSVCAWIKHNIPDTATIAFRKPMVFQLYTDRYNRNSATTFPAFNSTPEEVIQYFMEKKIEYAVLDTWYSAAFHTIVPAIQKYPAAFDILLELPGDIDNGINSTYIVKFNPEKIDINELNLTEKENTDYETKK
ncbi:MAG: hypothetical protein LBO69_09930 [Ignavibacteria bacterium]|jgi:hypothetical protein|nr:hypothetical protein [Ignavibacteria bacterium]